MNMENDMKVTVVWSRNLPATAEELESYFIWNSGYLPIGLDEPRELRRRARRDIALGVAVGIATVGVYLMLLGGGA